MSKSSRRRREGGGEGGGVGIKLEVVQCSSVSSFIIYLFLLLAEQSHVKDEEKRQSELTELSLSM
jgi:hypothetical protein